MPRVTLTKTTPPGSYDDAGVLLTMTAANTTDLNQFAPSDKDLVIAHNTGVTARTVTITSAPDEYGRVGHITAHNIPAGEIHIFGPFEVEGWRQADKFIYLQASHADVKFGVIAL